jgi:hypothetical protein
MRHPTLPEAAPVEVREDGVIHYYRAGWEECEAPPPPPPPAPMKSRTTEEKTDEAPAEPGASALPDTTPRRRATTRGDDK